MCAVHHTGIWLEETVTPFEPDLIPRRCYEKHLNVSNLFGFLLVMRHFNFAVYSSHVKIWCQ